MLTLCIVTSLLFNFAISRRYPAILGLGNHEERLALMSKLSDLVNEEYKNQVVDVEEIDRLPVTADHFPSIPQLNRNYTNVLFQGDIVLPLWLLRKLAEDGANTRQKRTTYRDNLYPMTIWKKGFPFAFHKSLNRAARHSILASIQFYRRHTCIRFRRRRKESVYVLFTGFDQGCFSSIGRTYTLHPQTVNIGPGCEIFGIATHEIGHALGLFHEQSRYDRDNWITLLLSRVPPSLRSQFIKVPPMYMDTYFTTYDVGSIMHYGPYDFSKNRKRPVLVAKNIDDQSSMGQLAGPSFRDVAILNRHYQCRARCPRKIHCYNRGIQDSKFCYKCKCPSGYGGPLCLRRQRPTLKRCGRKIRAGSKPRRLKVKIRAAPRAYKPRTCVFHIVVVVMEMIGSAVIASQPLLQKIFTYEAPQRAHVYLTVEKVKGTCVTGCWRETAEFKFRKDKSITGSRFCCKPEKKTRILTNTAVVPFTLKAIRKSAEITFQFKFVRGSGKRVSLDETNATLFGEPTRTIGEEFEIELQESLPEGVTAAPTPESTTETVEETDSSMELEDIEKETVEDIMDGLPELDEDLEAMLDDGNNVELGPISQGW